MVQSIITNGVIFYIHMAAANSADGTVDFTLDPLEGGPYLYEGERVDEEEAENSDPAAYTWTLTETEEKTPYAPTLQDVADEVVVNKQATDEQMEEVDGKATAAQQVASATANHFFADANGTHVASVAGNANSGFNTLGTSTGFAIRNGTDVLSAWSASAIEFYDNGATIASFGDTVTLGDDSKGHAEVDFNSLALYDTDGTNKVFEVGDMRNAQGVATLTETFTPTSAQTSFGLAFTPTAITSVTVDGTAVSYTVSGQTVTLATAAEVGETVAITYTTAAAVNSLTFGTRNGNTGGNSVVLGDAEASGELSIAEGYGTMATGQYSHAEGAGTVSRGRASHAEGWEAHARGIAAHAEGRNSTASGPYSHAEGSGTTASGIGAHAEGDGAVATAPMAHAEGNGARAVGNYSHAQNRQTIAQGEAQTALGAFNIAQGTMSSHTSSDHAVIVGNGTADNARSNAAELTWGGDLTLAGDIKTQGGAVRRTPQTIPLTNAGASGVTISTNRAVRSGNVVTLMVEITLTAAQSNFVTIMTGLPKSAMNISHLWTEGTWSTSYNRPLRCQVTTNGELQIRYGAATTYRLNTTYICAE